MSGDRRPETLGTLLRKMAGAAAPAVGAAPIWRRWSEIVGDEIARHAEPTSLRDGLLRIRADSPAWATELTYLGDEIRRSANQIAGRELVTAVRVWTGPGRPAPPVAGPPTPPEPPPARPRLDDPVAAVERARKRWAARRRGGRTDAG